MVMLHCILRLCLPIYHSWTSSRAHDKRKINLQRMTSEITHQWACEKTIFRLGIPTQRKLTNNKTWIPSKILRFSRQQQIQNITLFKYYTEKDKNKFWTELSSLGQEPTFNLFFRLYIHFRDICKQCRPITDAAKCGI